MSPNGDLFIVTFEIKFDKENVYIKTDEHELKQYLYTYIPIDFKKIYLERYV